MSKTAADVDTDAIERLIAELEGGDAANTPAKGPSKGPTKNAAAAAVPAASDDTDAGGNATTLQPWEYNPYANAAEQEKLQNLVDIDAVMGKSPAVDTTGVARVRGPAVLPPMRTAPGTAAPAASSEPLVTRPARQAVAAARDELLDLSPGKGQEDADADVYDGLAGRLHPQLEVHPVRPALGSLPPPARSDHTATAIDGRIILFGGLRAAGGNAAASGTTASAVSECVAYDESTGGWEPVFAARGDAPSARSLHGAAAVDLQGMGVPQHLVVIGGRDGNGDPLGDVHLFSVADQTWAHIETSGRVPAARFGHSVSAIGARAFVFGGRCIKSKGAESDTTPTKKSKSSGPSYTLSSDMYVLDVNKGVWHKVTGKKDAAAAAMEPGNLQSGDSVLAPDDSAAALSAHHPAKRYLHASCASADGTAIFIHGGFATGSQALGDLWKYDIATRGWTEIRRDGGVPRARHSLFYVDDNLVCVGGVCRTPGAGPVVTQAPFVASLSVMSPVWTNHQLVGHPLPQPTRAGHAAAVLNGVLCVHGGSSPAEAGEALASLLAVTVSSSMLPRCDPLPRGLDAPLVGVAALDFCRRHHSVPFDLAIDVDAGTYVPCHAGVLALRAPKLYDLISCLEHQPVASAMPSVPTHYSSRAKAVRVMSSRHHNGLPHPLSRDTLEAIVGFLYTAELPVVGHDAVATATFYEQSLLPATRAYVVEHLEHAVERALTGEASAPDADASAKFSVRRLEAQVLARQRLQSGLSALVDDSLTADCVLQLRSSGDDADDTESGSVRFHSYIAAGRSEPLRRVLHGLLGPARRASFSGAPDNSHAAPKGNTTYSDRQSGLVATWRPSALRAGSDMILVSVGDGTSGRQLPSLKSAVVAAFQHMYDGGVDGVREDNAVEVLMAARVLDLPQLAAAAERVIVAHIDEATAMDDTDALSPSELVALLQLGDTHGAEHVTSRVTVAAAKVFDRVREDPSFAQLSTRVRGYVQTVAAQCGWRA